ncbi:hypothetical protein NMG60_11014428 [Bertholletia excelsa]
MVSRQHKKASMYRNPRLLRNSHAESRCSAVLDFLKYLKHTRKKLEGLVNQDIAEVKVESMEETFVVSVSCEGSCTGLLVFILEALQAVGLEVLHARVSCSDNFHLEAIGTFENEEQAANAEVQGVKEAVMQAIHEWRGSNEKE